jgi:hypothetical protein
LQGGIICQVLVDVKMQVVGRVVARGEVAAAYVPAPEDSACVPLAGTSCHTNKEFPALR